jgi:hypothetical protein
MCSSLRWTRPSRRSFSSEKPSKVNSRRHQMQEENRAGICIGHILVSISTIVPYFGGHSFSARNRLAIISADIQDFGAMRVAM